MSFLFARKLLQRQGGGVTLRQLALSGPTAAVACGHRLVSSATFTMAPAAATAAAAPSSSSHTATRPVLSAADVQLRHTLTPQSNNNTADSNETEQAFIRRIFLQTSANAADDALDETVNDAMRSDLAYSLSFAHDYQENDFGLELEFPLQQTNLFPMQTKLMREQLEISNNQLLQQQQLSTTDSTKSVNNKNMKRIKDRALPKTLQDAMRASSSHDDAIVVTEATAPFAICHVNKAWEDLCGYTFLESKGKTLGSLLQGPETDTMAATGLIASLLRGEEEEIGTTLTNYTKTGRKFRNRIRVGPIQNDLEQDFVMGQDPSAQEAKYFVGVLKEVQEGM